ncbi:MAG: hypothetical protein AAF711_20080, partial [Planctomycetota bacterium]
MPTDNPTHNAGGTSPADDAPRSEDIDPPRDEQTKVDTQVILVMLGSTALVASLISYLLFDTPEQPAMLAMIAAILLGTPVTINTVRSIFGRTQQQQHTEELVMLAF